MRKELSKIPRLKFDTDRIAAAAEVAGCYCYKSAMDMTEVCINDKNTLILTRNNGYLVIPHSDLSGLITELQDLQRDIERIEKVVQ